MIPAHTARQPSDCDDWLSQAHRHDAVSVSVCLASPERLLISSGYAFTKDNPYKRELKERKS